MRDHVIKAGAVTVTVSHALMGLEVTDAAGNIVLSEIYPLTWNTSSLWQTIALAQDEQIFGGGMQVRRPTSAVLRSSLGVTHSALPTEPVSDGCIDVR